MNLRFCLFSHFTQQSLELLSGEKEEIWGWGGGGKGERKSKRKHFAKVLMDTVFPTQQNCLGQQLLLSVSTFNLSDSNLFLFRKCPLQNRVFLPRLFLYPLRSYSSSKLLLSVQNKSSSVLFFHLIFVLHSSRRFPIFISCRCYFSELLLT